MKKAISLIVAFVLCLGLCACGQDTPDTSTTQNPGGSENTTPSTTQTAPTTPTQTEPKPLANFDILCEWIIADDGLAVITFNEDGICIRDGEAAVKYKVEADVAVLTIYYSTPQSYNIEKVGEHYRIIGEHFLLREVEQSEIQEIAAKQEKYEQALALLEPYLPYAERPWQAITTLGNKDIIAAYTLFQEIGNYRDAADHLERFIVAEDVLLKDRFYYYGYDINGQQIWQGTDRFDGYRYYYDNNDRLIRVIYDSTETVYTYNDKGQLLEQRTNYYHPDGVQILSYETTSYTYNEDGLLTREDHYYSSYKTLPEYSDYTIYTYDNQGQLIRKEGVYAQTAHDEEGNPYIRYDDFVEAWDNKYSEQGHLIERHFTTGRSSYQTIAGRNYTCYENDILYFTYDDCGNLIEVNRYTIYGFEDYVLYNTIQYCYENGNFIKETDIRYSQEGTESEQSTYEYTYGTFYWYNAPEA